MLSLSFLMFLFHGKCLRPRPVCIRMMKKESNNTHPQVDGRTDVDGRITRLQPRCQKTLCQRILTSRSTSVEDGWITVEPSLRFPVPRELVELKLIAVSTPPAAYR